MLMMSPKDEKFTKEKTPSGCGVERKTPEGSCASGVVNN